MRQQHRFVCFLAFASILVLSGCVALQQYRIWYHAHEPFLPLPKHAQHIMRDPEDGSSMAIGGNGYIALHLAEITMNDIRSFYVRYGLTCSSSQVGEAYDFSGEEYLTAPLILCKGKLEPFGYAEILIQDKASLLQYSRPNKHAFRYVAELVPPPTQWSDSTVLIIARVTWAPDPIFY